MREGYASAHASDETMRVRDCCRELFAKVLGHTFGKDLTGRGQGRGDVDPGLSCSLSSSAPTGAVIE
jgi:hypothetical protein